MMAGELWHDVRGGALVFVVAVDDYRVYGLWNRMQSSLNRGVCSFDRATFISVMMRVS